MIYDSNGRLFQLWENTSSGTSAVTYNYTTDANGKITAVTADLPDSSHRKLQFDTNHYLTSDTRANGSTNPPAETTTYTRDAATELVTSIREDPVGRVTNFVYDNGGAIAAANLTKVTEAPGPSGAAITHIRWQCSASVGRDTSVSKAMLETSSYEYNALNRVTSATDANGKTTTFSYDLMGNLTTLTDPLNHATTWSYTPPLGDSWDVQECDPANNCNDAHLNWLSGLPGWTQDKAGIQTSFTRDALQRVTKAIFNSNNVSGFNQTNIQYTYDELDRPTTITDTGGGSPSSPGNTQAIGYDLLDNVISEQAPEGT